MGIALIAPIPQLPLKHDESSFGAHVQALSSRNWIVVRSNCLNLSYKFDLVLPVSRVRSQSVKEPSFYRSP